MTVLGEESFSWKPAVEVTFGSSSFACRSFLARPVESGDKSDSKEALVETCRQPPTACRTLLAAHWPVIQP